ncbi:MAG: PadR family transcriptional regulator [Actinomycetaceae bacterium]|nr:PadR family transcriptional regulator [Actinomycetaceae bacterium]
MSVKHALLALLAAGPAGTYKLRKDFESSTGSTWPLNIGQVATTLSRLERDGLVVRRSPESASALADANEAANSQDDATGRTAQSSSPVLAKPAPTGHEIATWSLTDAGHTELSKWWQSPVARHTPGRDELIIKLSLAVSTAAATGVDVTDLVQRQRQASQATLHEITRARRNGTEDLAASLVMDHHVFAIEAELRWLDIIEGRLARAAAASRGPNGGADTSTSANASPDGSV